MTPPSVFSFDSVTLDRDARAIRLVYVLDDGTRFVETFTLPAELPLPVTLSPELERLLFALHLAAGVSYYKAYCPPTIAIRNGQLSQPEAAFWTDVYEQGLGEFFYQNAIDFRGLIKFPITKATAPKTASPTPPAIKRVLVPVGGGKDSAVTIELLREAGVPMTLLRVGQHPLIDAFVQKTGLPCLTVERQISPELIRLNAAGAKNGHVPVTAILSLLALIVATLRGDDAVVMSNESSADEGNTEYLGRTVNHQWSKGLEFETGLQKYLVQTVRSTVRYFSLLRPLNELQIAQLFARHEQYFELCTSCNRNWTLVKQRPDERWCGQCPKCAFVFALLAAHLDRPQVLAAFGEKNLFADPSLAPLYRQLLGIQGFKPFECVGTPAETAAAFLMAHERGHFEGDAMMEFFKTEALPAIADPHALIDTALEAKGPHAIPADFLALLHAPR